MADDGHAVELTAHGHSHDGGGSGEAGHGGGAGHSHGEHGCCDGHDHGAAGEHGHGHGHAAAHAHGAVVPKEADIFNLARQQNFPLVVKLLEAYPQYWTAKDEDGHSLMHWAALVGSLDFVQTALEHGLSVDVLANNKQTPLMWAVLRGHVGVAKVLLDAKANLQLHDSLGATSMMISIQHRQYLCMLLMMHRGSKDSLLRDTDKNGCTSGHWAAYKGDLTALKFLSYFGADLLALDNSKMLPLHRAVSASQHTVVEFLMDKCSDASARNADGKSCLDIVEQNQDVPMQTLLKKLIAKQAKKAEGKGGLDLEQAVGEDFQIKHAFKDKAMHKVFPVFWVMCVSLALFTYLIDQRDLGWRVSPLFTLQFEIGVPLSLAVFAWAALMDPGIIKPKERGHSGVEEIMRMIDSAPADGPVVDISRLCTTTWVLKGLRTKYCVQTGACVEEFDHYCIWLNCAIGKRNHRPFVLLAMVEFWTQVCHLYICWCTAREVPYSTFGSWVSMLLMAYPMLVLISIAHCITAPWVFMLVMHQFRLITTNLTTNEIVNVQRYDHFWVVNQVAPGHMQKQFRNPFNKGGFVANWLDFWWYQNRGYAAAMDHIPAGCGARHCRNCP